MKLLRYISYVLIPCVIMSAVLFTSCEEDGSGASIETPEGKPVIDYVRIADPASSDSLLVSAQLGSGIVIVGKNLGGSREVWFNDKKVSLVPTWVTNNTIFVDVPGTAPNKVTNIMYVVNADKDTLKYPFVVAIPPPSPQAAKNEWPRKGESLIILGNYFFAPITVTFTGGVKGEVKTVTQTAVEVVVPDGAQEGPVTVATNFGKTVSSFYFRDSRNMILNYDNLTTTGSWRTGVIQSDDKSLSGNYVKFEGQYAKPAERNEGPGPASPYESQFWAKKSGRPQGNFLPGDPAKYVMKFEINVVKWYGAHLNICWAPWDWDNSNQEIWSNDVNARAVWGPWEKDNKEFTTNGEWVTVTIPMTEFKYAMSAPSTGIVYNPAQFKPNVTGSLTFWVVSGLKEDKPAPFEFLIDNVRVVPK